MSPQRLRAVQNPREVELPGGLTHSYSTVEPAQITAAKLKEAPDAGVVCNHSHPAGVRLVLGLEDLDSLLRQLVLRGQLEATRIAGEWQQLAVAVKSTEVEKRHGVGEVGGSIPGETSVIGLEKRKVEGIGIVQLGRRAAGRYYPAAGDSLGPQRSGGQGVDEKVDQGGVDALQHGLANQLESFTSIT